MELLKLFLTKNANRMIKKFPTVFFIFYKASIVNNYVNYRSQIAELRGSQINRFTLDGTLKRIADFGSQRDHTGQREYALRYWTHLG